MQAAIFSLRRAERGEDEQALSSIVDGFEGPLDLLLELRAQATSGPQRISTSSLRISISHSSMPPGRFARMLQIIS